MNMKTVENLAILVATLSLIIFLISLFLGEIELGWLNTAIWAILYWSKP